MYSNIMQAYHISLMCLISSGINSLPVTLAQICKNSNTKIIKNSSMSEKALKPKESSRLIMHASENYIIVNDAMHIVMQRYAIACKLGYIYIGFNITDYESDHFATNLLAPLCILRNLNIQNPNRIADVCSIPQTVARYQSRQLKKHISQESNPIESLVCKQFHKFISNYNT